MSTATRRHLYAAPFANGLATVLLEGRVVATLLRTPGSIEVIMNDIPVGAGRKVSTALDTVAVNLALAARDPRSAAERQADACYADQRDTIASQRAGL